MKLRTLLCACAGLFAAGTLLAQDPIVITPGAATLETTINADTTDTGERNNPNQVYELEAGGVYIMNSGIKVSNLGGNTIIRGQEGGKKPVIVRVSVDEVEVSNNSIEGSLTMENVHYQAAEMTTGQVPWSSFNLSGDGSALTVDNCIIEFNSGIIFNLNSVLHGAKISVKNSYFRDQHNFDQWWQARAIQAKVPVTEFLFENNTVTGGGLTILGQACLFEYAVINHNTFINNHKYPFLNQYWKECYFTNNLFVNANMVGEDMENVASGGQDPDALLHGIVGVDTVIAKQIQMEEKWYDLDAASDSTVLSDDIDEISDYIFYVADNVIVSSATLDAYYGGTPNDGIDGAPSSYLTWGGAEGPFEILSVPGIWSNSRTDALVAEYDNLKMEDNSVYEMRAADLGMGTEALPQTAADVFIEWNRNAWAVPDVEKPTDFSAYYFGDYDAATVPGVEVEDAPTGEGGLTKISDFIEDFSYTADLKSTIDEKPIGALHWDDMDYDSDMLTAKVKAAYNGTLGFEDKFAAIDSKFELKNYPNPFSMMTTISFKLEKDSYVSLEVYDISGRRVASLIDGMRSMGAQTVEFTPDFSASSTYFLKLTTDFGSETRKMMMLK